MSIENIGGSTVRQHGDPVRGSNVSQSPLYEGRFGRMFRRLSAAPTYDDGVLAELAEQMREPVAQPTGWNAAVVDDRDHAHLPAGYTYFGQFVDHDITFDAATSLDRTNDPDALVNFRTARYDLDSLYGSGPTDEPFQYDSTNPAKLLVDTANPAAERDLPRNEQDLALIGDPRNDENIIISQLHLAFALAHNKFVDQLTAGGVARDRVFHEAQRHLRWHYQWLVLHDFLPRICDPDILHEVVFQDDDGITNIQRRYYRPTKNAYIPVEFSAAAYRFGHSLVRGRYNLNPQILDRPIFAPGDNVDPTGDLRGRRHLPAGWTIAWNQFVVLDGSTPQPARRLDHMLVEGLLDLPGADPASLALRNLRTGQRHQLPSGQDVATAMRQPVMTPDELGGGVPDPTPLWFYLLREAEVRAHGQHLGPVGTRIVAEVLAGLVELDRQSFYSQRPAWTPTLPTGRSDPSNRFTLADLVAWATDQ